MEITRKQITRAQAEEIRKAFIRLGELREAKIVTKESDAEIARLNAFLNDAACTHFNELMGCWFAVNTEYAPLVNALAPVISRVAEAINARNEKSS